MSWRSVQAHFILLWWLWVVSGSWLKSLQVTHHTSATCCIRSLRPLACRPRVFHPWQSWQKLRANPTSFHAPASTMSPEPNWSQWHGLQLPSPMKPSAGSLAYQGLPQSCYVLLWPTPLLPTLLPTLFFASVQEALSPPPSPPHMSRAVCSCLVGPVLTFLIHIIACTSWDDGSQQFEQKDKVLLSQALKVVGEDRKPGLIRTRHVAGKCLKSKRRVLKTYCYMPVTVTGVTGRLTQ